MLVSNEADGGTTRRDTIQISAPNWKPALEWCLETHSRDGRLGRILLSTFPFRVGRRVGLELTLESQSVSKEHAEVYREGATLRVRDLESTNGTFLNHARVRDAALKEGDIVHFANLEFRLARVLPGSAKATPGESTAATSPSLSHNFAQGTRELKELLVDGLVTVLFQPILGLPGREIVAYEVLGRGAHPGLPQDPLSLFGIARNLGVEMELSQLFRRKAVEIASHRTDLPTLFLNTHPAEGDHDRLVHSLRVLRDQSPHLKLVIEIHEKTLSGPERLGILRGRLAELDMRVAYDDFGAGQARLLELAEAPPDYLKFDISFIREIDKAAPSKRRLLSSLVAAAQDLLVQTIAEGVETLAEAEVCNKVGFNLAQGYLFGRPFAIEQI